MKRQGWIDLKIGNSENSIESVQKRKLEGPRGNLPTLYSHIGPSGSSRAF